MSAFDEDGNEVGIVFQTASPFDTPRVMEELVTWTNTAFDEENHHPLLIIAIFTVVFLEIHPFQDGNGRLSRVLTTLLLLRAGYNYVPYRSLENIVEHSKEGYYLALRQTQETIRSNKPNWSPWVSYFLKALQQQKRRLQTKIKREKIMVEQLPELSLQILDLARQLDKITNAMIVRATRANRNTVKKHLQALVDSGHLQKLGLGKGTAYSCGMA